MFSLNFPASQSVQSADSAEENFPVGHMSHDDEATLIARLPAVQIVQAPGSAWREGDEALSALNLPVGQSVHEEEPREEYLPIVHVSHDVLKEGKGRGSNRRICA